MSKDTVGDTDDEMPPLSYDNSSPTTSKQPPLPNEPIDFGNTPEIKVLVDQSAPKLPSLTSLLQAAVDSGQFGKVPTSVVTDSGSPFPTQAMDLGPGKHSFAVLSFIRLNMFQIFLLLIQLSSLPKVSAALPQYVSLMTWYLGWTLVHQIIRRPSLS